MCFLLVLTLLVLVTGSSASHAADTDASNESFEEVTDVASVDDSQSADMENNYEKNNTKTVEKGLSRNSRENLKGSNLKDISLYVDDIECDYGDIVDIPVITEPEVDEGILSFYLNNRIVGATNLSYTTDSFSLNTINLIPGTYELLVSYSASLNYENNQTTSTFVINPAVTDFSNIRMEFNDDNDIDVSLNVEASDGETLFYGYLNVYSGNDLIKTVEIEDYDVTFTIDKTYNQDVLILEYVGDEYYTDCIREVLVYVEKENLNIYLPYLNVYHGDIANESLTFYGSRLINDGKVRVYVDGVFVEQIDVNGSEVDVVIDTINYLVGSHSIYIEYVDSDVYEDASYQTTLNIKQISTTLYTYNITAHKNDIINLRALVYNYVDQINDGIIEFLVDNESVKTALVTNSNINEEYLVPDTIGYGEHNLTVIYHGTQRYQEKTQQATLNVIKYSNSLSLRNYTLDDEGRIILNIRAYSYNNTVDSGELKLYVDGTLISTVNVTDNITSIRLPEEYSADNTYEIRAVYENSDKFEDATFTSSITHERYNTTTRIYDFINSQNLLNITAYVYSTNYADINEGSVTFYLNDTPVATVNVQSNAANMIYDMDNMTETQYNLTCRYNGTNVYRESENATEINFSINRKTLYITTNTSIRTVPGSDITINARLTDYEGNLINLTTTANLSILGENFEVEFIQGQLTYTKSISENQPESTSNISIIIPQTKYYKNTTRTVYLTIAKLSPYISSTNTITSNKYETVTVNATLNLNREKISENITGIIKVNNQTVYRGKFINGTLSYSLVLNNRYTRDNYTITIKSQETGTYHSAQKDITLILNSRQTYITSQNIVSKNGEKIIINASVYDRITRDYVKGTSKACIKINDVTLDNINITNGRLVYSYVNDYSAKNYTIKIIYGENGIYSSSTWNGTLTIESSPLSIITNNINSPAYSTINIKAKILDGNKLASGIVPVAIKINNITIIHENITDGIIDINYTLNDSIKAGTHNLTIIAGDTRAYSYNTTTVDLIVTRNYKYIETSQITSTAGSTINIKANIYDASRHLVDKNTKVSIKINQNTIVDMNVTDGIIDYNYTLPTNINPGLYNLIIKAGESSGYYHATTNTILKVE